MLSRFNPSGMTLLVWLVFFLSIPSCLWGQQKKQGPPPANVTVALVKSGMVAPQAEFIATVFYQEISDTAAEMSGLVEAVRFEEGQRVQEQQILVELGSELLQKRLQAAISSYEQILSELQIARIDLKRRENLFKKKSISEQSFDESRYRVIGLEKRAAALKAQVEQFEIELKKKVIRAPFEGVVIKRQVDRGEWVSEGETVAVIGKDDTIDIVAEIPERIIPFIKDGMQIRATVNDNNFSGKVIAIVPRGDVATRTFPIKIRTANDLALIEGMSARVILPTANRIQALIIPRDAVISKFGQNIVFAAVNTTAKMIPVQVIGYNGLDAGVEAQGLNEGMLVVVEGNERLRNEQEVVYQSTEDRGQRAEGGGQNSEGGLRRAQPSRMRKSQD
ncbi:MAG: efflux RND transporter periplasmic adaptor subunit [Deltaproteobacteria bacterium]|jgi:RND family efflux transporter MFP subunit|nr:efflux RND transporter periplasmic adaptor subunit [Deltaproteobacteria bacterium]